MPFDLQGLADRAVGNDPAVGGQHDEPVHEIDPRSQHMLDDDERGGRRAGQHRGSLARGVASGPFGPLCQGT